MNKARPKVVWVVLTPRNTWGFGFTQRKKALDFKRACRADAAKPYSRKAWLRELYKHLKVMRVEVQYEW